MDEMMQDLGFSPSDLDAEMSADLFGMLDDDGEDAFLEWFGADADDDDDDDDGDLFEAMEEDRAEDMDDWMRECWESEDLYWKDRR
jgi:hypothetical protein